MLQTKIGSLPQVRPGRPHHEHGRQHVEGEQRHRDPDEGEEGDVGVHTHVRLVVQRRVPGPAGREAAVEDGRAEEQPARHQQPEGERLDAREGQAPGPDHQRQEVAPERAEDPARHHPHHHRAVQPDQGEVLAGAEHVRLRPQELEADQHRVDAAEEDEEADPDQVLETHHLVVGAVADVARPAARVVRLVVVNRGRPSGDPGERVVEEAEPGQEADHAEQVGEEEGDVVLARVADEVEALGVDLVAEPPPQVVADRGENYRGEEVEAEQPPEPHPALRCGSGE